METTQMGAPGGRLVEGSRCRRIICTGSSRTSHHSLLRWLTRARWWTVRPTGGGPRPHMNGPGPRDEEGRPLRAPRRAASGLWATSRATLAATTTAMPATTVVATSRSPPQPVDVARMQL